MGAGSYVAVGVLHGVLFFNLVAMTNAIFKRGQGATSGISHPGAGGVGFNIETKFGSSVFVISRLGVGSIAVSRIRGGCGVNCFNTLFVHVGVGGRCVRPRISCGMAGYRVAFSGLNSRRPTVRPSCTSIRSMLRDVSFPILCNCGMIGGNPCKVSVFTNPGLHCL